MYLRSRERLKRPGNDRTARTRKMIAPREARDATAVRSALREPGSRQPDHAKITARQRPDNGGSRVRTAAAAGMIDPVHRWIAIAALAAACTPAGAAPSSKEAGGAIAVFERHCRPCHAGPEPSGG